jgi:beta-lactamase class A
MSYYTSYTPKQHTPTKKKRHFKRYFALLLILIIVVGGSLFALHSSKSTNANSVSSKKIATTTAVKQKSNVREPDLTSLASQVNSIINTNSNIEFSVTTVDLNSGLSEHYGDNASYDAASIGKLVTATTLLHEVQAGQVSLSQTLDDGNTVQYDLQQMIVISDDNTWATLNDFLTHPVMQAYADNIIGMTGYDADNNTMKNTDVATLLQKLWNGQLLNTQYTKLLLSYMKIANYRGYMLPAIPASYTTYHKVGLDEDNVHDVAIITKGGRDIILAIFTNGNGTYDWPNRAAIMQQIAKIVLNAYFVTP